MELLATALPTADADPPADDGTVDDGRPTGWTSTTRYDTAPVEILDVDGAELLATVLPTADANPPADDGTVDDESIAIGTRPAQC